MLATRWLYMTHLLTPLTKQPLRDYMKGKTVSETAGNQFYWPDRPMKNRPEEWSWAGLKIAKLVEREERMTSQLSWGSK